MNNKGFSLIELLAIMTILGLIMGIAIPAYQHYVTDTRKEAYNTLVTTARTAAQNKFMDDGLPSGCTSYSIEDLYTGGYMDKPSDPASTATNCGGTVYIKSGSSSSTMETYSINVVLECSVEKRNECKDTGGGNCSNFTC